MDDATSKKGSSDGEAASGGGTRLQSVARAAQLMLWVAEQPHGAAAREIAMALGLALPTTYHLINTLVDQGFLAKDMRRRYILGDSVAVLAQKYLRGKAVPESLLSAVYDVAQRSEETAYLADWGEHDIRVLASVEGTRMVRVAEVASGPYEHGHARANGKVLLAYASPEVRRAYLASHPLVRLTENTICDPERFEQELRRIHSRGYAYDQEEYAAGLSCVAVPLFRGGAMVAVMGLAVPAERFKKRRREITQILLDQARALQMNETGTTAAGH